MNIVSYAVKESQGMLLAVEDDDGVSLLKPDREMAPGTKVH